MLRLHPQGFTVPSLFLQANFVQRKKGTGPFTVVLVAVDCSDVQNVSVAPCDQSKVRPVFATRIPFGRRCAGKLQAGLCLRFPVPVHPVPNESSEQPWQAAEQCDNAPKADMLTFLKKRLRNTLSKVGLGSATIEPMYPPFGYCIEPSPW